MPRTQSIISHLTPPSVSFFFPKSPSPSGAFRHQRVRDGTQEAQPFASRALASRRYIYIYIYIESCSKSRKSNIHMSLARIRWSKRMTEEIRNAEMGSSAAATVTSAKSRSLWPTVLRWIPTSTDRIIASEKRLLSLVK
jgi:hypothetical protein